MAEIKLLLADVDGTLVTKEKILTPRAIAAVQKLRAKGIKFAITSGRPPKGMEMLLKPLGIDTPIAGFNGGLWVNPDLSQIESRNLTRDVADKTVKMLLEDNLDVWVYSGEDWLVRKAGAPHVARDEWTVNFPPKVVSDFGKALDTAVKIVGVSDDLDQMEKAEKRVQDALGHTASAARSQPYYLDVTHPEANKGFALGFLAKRLGLDEKSIATIGDQPNDTLMFAKGGISKDEGFANAVEKYLLGDNHG
jgi:Cof subfamily protein (haloacid dehalogenase superfamily)